MHTAIALTINVGFFTPAMFVLYLAVRLDRSPQK